MTVDDIKEWKNKLLKPIQERMRERTATLQGAATLRPESRLSVGYSQHRSGLHLELRVQREDGPAWKQAEQVRSKHPKEVNLAVVGSIEVAPAKAVLEHKPFSERLIVHHDTGPLCLGSSVSHCDEAAPGTLGGFVEDKNGHRSILSAAHVLALRGGANKADRVVHPAGGDVRQLTDEHFIGRLTRFAVLSLGKANSTDAAYARLDDNINSLGNVIPDGVGAPTSGEGKPIRFDPALVLGENEKLAKVGRTSGYTEGILNAIGFDNLAVLVRGIGVVYFDNCLEVRGEPPANPFTQPGDSGAAVFTKNGRHACGIHFASADAALDGSTFRASYACDLGAILSVFSLTWL